MVDLQPATRREIDARLTARRDLTEGIAAGRLSLADVLSAGETSEWSDVRILAALDALPDVGKVPVRRGLAKMNIDESTVLGDLAGADVDALLEVFG